MQESARSNFRLQAAHLHNFTRIITVGLQHLHKDTHVLQASLCTSRLASEPLRRMQQHQGKTSATAIFPHGQGMRRRSNLSSILIRAGSFIYFYRHAAGNKARSSSLQKLIMIDKALSFA